MNVQLRFAVCSVVIAMVFAGIGFGQSYAPISGQGTASAAKPAIRLAVQAAEGIALRSNPAISAARLNALASQQVTREVRSNLWPQA